LSLLAASIVQRPYVFTFLAVFLFLAGRDLGWLRMLGWLGWGFLVAFTAEYWSTRVGIPFGLYHYTGATAGRGIFHLQRALLRSAVLPLPRVCLVLLRAVDPPALARMADGSAGGRPHDGPGRGHRSAGRAR